MRGARSDVMQFAYDSCGFARTSFHQSLVPWPCDGGTCRLGWLARRTDATRCESCDKFACAAAQNVYCGLAYDFEVTRPSTFQLTPR
jgi:hypothetical protein